MQAADKIAVINKYVEAFDKKDISIIKSIYADNAVVEDPVGSDPYRGINDILAFYEQGLSMGAKLSLTDKPRCAGKSVAFSFIVTVGAMKIDVTDVFEFNDAGKIVSMKAYWGPENITQ